MNKKNIDRILTAFDRVSYIMVIIMMLIYTVATVWAGNVYSEMEQAVEKNSSIYEEVISTEERTSEIYEEVIKVTEENSEIYKELMQLLAYPKED